MIKTFISNIAVFIRSLFFYCGYVLIFLSFGCLIPLRLLLPQSTMAILLHRACAVALLWLRCCCGIRFEVLGMEHLPREACVICCNHQSPWETYAMMCIFPGRTVVSVLKKELLRIPIFGWGLRASGHIPINRSAPRQAMSSLLQKGTQTLQKGISIVVFPEGTRLQPGQQKPFSQGAAQLAKAAACPIVPIAHNAGECWPAHRLQKYPGTIRVHIGAALHPHNTDTRELTLKLEQWVRTQQQLLPPARST